MDFKRVCKTPARVLTLNSCGFFTSTRAFSKGDSLYFPKAHALRYGCRKCGNDWMYISGEWAFRKWHWSKFQWYRPECSGWIQMHFWPLPMHFGREPPFIFRNHMPWGISTYDLGMIGCIFAENGPLKFEWTFKVWVAPYVVLRVNSYVFLTYTRAFSDQEP